MGPRNSDVFIALMLLATVLAQSSEVGSPPDYSGTKQREGPGRNFVYLNNICLDPTMRFHHLHKDRRACTINLRHVHSKSFVKKIIFFFKL